MIPTYNRPEYLAATLRAVLAQDPGEEQMQIMVVDDCSTVGDAAMVVAEAAGPRVRYYRNPENLGIARTWNACLSWAEGQWVHILHDDDVPLPGFYREFQKLIHAQPDVDLIFCQAVAINEHDELQFAMYRPSGTPVEGGVLIPNPCHDLILGNYLVTPTVTLRRSVLEKVGGFNPALSHTADWEMWMRVGTVSAFGYVDQPLLHYRQHGGSDTSRGDRELLHLRERLRCIDLCLESLSPTLRTERRRVARRATARGCNFYRKTMHGAGQHIAGIRYAWVAWTLHSTLRNGLRFFQSLIKGIVGFFS